MAWAAEPGGNPEPGTERPGELDPGVIPKTDQPALILERGPDHRVVEWYSQITDESGTALTLTNRYTEVATGLHFLDANGEWQDTVAAFEAVPNGWVAARGPHQVALSSDLSVPGSVTVVTVDGVTLRSTPTLLAYVDRATGQEVRLADLQSTQGELIAPGTVLYANAFNAVAADVRAIYTAVGFECDVILRGPLPDPAEFGLNPDTTDLAVFTEFFETQPTERRDYEVPVKEGEFSTDMDLDFGAMRMDRGKAFLLPSGESLELPVRKSWEAREGREFLIERTSWSDLEPMLRTLPEGAFVPKPIRATGKSTSTARIQLPERLGTLPIWPRSVAGRLVASANREATSPRAVDVEAGAARRNREISGDGNKEFARHEKPIRPGVVLDYTLVGTTTNYSFNSLETYYVSGAVTLGGSGSTVTFQPGTVVKYAKNAGANLRILSGTTINWLGAPYRPVVLTAYDDNSVGELLPNATGSPQGVYANNALELDGTGRTTPLVLTNLCVRNASSGILANRFETSSSTLTVRHGQFVECDGAFRFRLGLTTQPTYFVQNAVVTSTIAGSTVWRNLFNAVVKGEFVTVDGVGSIRQSVYNPDNSSVGLVNSLVYNVNDTAGVTRTSSPIVPANLTAFVTAGSGAHYLNLADSAVHNFVATADQSLIPSDLGAELDGSTVRPPIAVASSVAVNLTLSGGELNDLLDNASGATGFQTFVGYHYWPIHYLAQEVAVNGATVILTNAVSTLTTRVVLAGRGTSALQLGSGSKFISQGRPQALHRLCWSSAVQELPTGGAPAGSRSLFKVVTGTSVWPEIRLKLNEADFNADGTSRRGLVTINQASQYTSLIEARDSQFRGIYLDFTPATYPGGVAQNLVLFNNVWQDSTVGAYRNVDGAHNVTIRHNLFRGGSFTLYYYFVAGMGNPVWVCRDNLFEGGSLSYLYSMYVNSGWNGYTSSTATYGGSNNKLGLAPDWKNGPLGPWYYPSAATNSNLGVLLGAGSQTAANAGLFHYTTQVSQAKDGTNDSTSPVDIGFHYVATTGSPSIEASDLDGDSIPDYLEDSDGDGSVDSNEFNWMSSRDTDLDFVDDADEFFGKPNGHVVSWGATSTIPDEAANLPASTTYISVAAGHSHSLGMRHNGMVTAWGANNYGQTTVPPAATDAIAVAAGESHSLIIKDSGALQAWGDNTYAQISPLPNPNSGFTAISTRYRHNLALKTDGTVVGWGDNGSGQLNNLNTLSGVTQVAAGQNFSLFLINGGVVSRGSITVPTAATTGVVEIAAGYLHAVVLKTDGTVVCFGDNTSGACTPPVGLNDVLHVTAGYRFSVALKNDGTLVAWGDNAYGQTSVPASLTDVQAISAGYRHVNALPFSPVLDYPVDVTRDFLLLANGNSTPSMNVANYYLATRPGMLGCTNLVISQANPLSFDITVADAQSGILAPIQTWLAANPTRRPRYLLLSCEHPQRITPISPDNGSLQHWVRTNWPGKAPVIGGLNMLAADCTNYVDKLAGLGHTVSRLKAHLSASLNGYNNGVICLDDHEGYVNESYPVQIGFDQLNSSGIATGHLYYKPKLSSHITTATNVSAYISWGGNALSYQRPWSNDGTVMFTGDSRWWIIQTVESYNGMWEPLLPNDKQGSYRRWFSATAFGGAGYSRTPIGSVQQVYEPTLVKVNDTYVYFGLWYAGRGTGIAAWRSRKSEYHAFTGDPMIVR